MNKLRLFVICSTVFSALTVISGFALFVSGMLAAAVSGGISAPACATLRVHADCQDKCGCGWCNYNSSLSSCQPVDNYHCSAGVFDETPSERCESLYDTRITVVIVTGSLTGFFALIVCVLIAVACYCDSKPKYKTHSAGKKTTKCDPEKELTIVET